MKTEELIPYLTKFVTVTLDDDTEVSGFISNPAELKQNPEELHKKVVLLNGLQYSDVDIYRIVSIRESVREDTTEIPIIGDSYMLQSDIRKKEEFNDRLDELFDKVSHNTLEVVLPNGKTIDNTKK